MNPIPDNTPGMLRRGQIAKLLGLSAETIDFWLDSGRLPFTQASDGKAWRYVQREDLISFCERRGFRLNWQALK